MDTHIPVQDRTQHLHQALSNDLQALSNDNITSQSTDSDAQHETEVSSQPEMEGLSRRSGRIRSQLKWMEDYVPL